MTNILAAVAVCVLALLTVPWAASSQGDLSISGTVWLDENADGIRQPSEEGMGHEFVTLRAQNGLRLEARSDAMGNYSFTGLDEGQYVIGIKVFPPRSSMMMTHPSIENLPPFEQQVMLADASLTGIDFGLHAPHGVPHFTGLVWVDAALAVLPDVRTLIDGVDCSGPYTFAIPPGSSLGFATFAVSVLSEDLKPACGTPGARIVFTVDGRLANETATWEALPQGEPPPFGGNQLTLTVGEPFAYFNTRVDETARAPGFSLYRRLVVAMIDGKVCSITPGDGFGSALIGVPSEEQAPGCGRPGKVVTFAVDGFAVPEIVLWQAGERPDVSFTFDPSREATLAGTAFAYFELVPESDQETIHVNAYVGDVFCGGTVGGAGDTLLVAVAPDELIAGCGREGAMVTFEVNGAAFGDPVPWEPGFQDGPGVSNGDSESPPASVTPGGSLVTPPNAGSAGLKR